MASFKRNIELAKKTFPGMEYLVNPFKTRFGQIATAYLLISLAVKLVSILL